MKIKIDAVDTLFFRDGKPFALGEENWANGIFPPAPSVFYGSLRTSYFSNNLNSFKKLNTKEDESLNLKINGIFYFIDNSIAFPLPADLVMNKHDNKIYKTTLFEKPNISNFPLEKFLSFQNNNDIERPQEEMLLKFNFFAKYLSGNFDELQALKLNDYITIEPKIGIGRKNSTKSAAESMIYRVGMRRLEKNIKKNKISFVVDYDGLSLPSEGILKLGGEGRPAKYKRLTEEELSDFNNLKPEITSNLVKIYFLTPAIFENGSIPNMNNPLFKKYNMKLISAAVSGFKYIGGFDMESKTPKPMYRAVKEGAVYYFTFEGDKKALVDDFFFNSISDFNLANQGFGITLAGNV